VLVAVAVAQDAAPATAAPAQAAVAAMAPGVVRPRAAVAAILRGTTMAALVAMGVRTAARRRSRARHRTIGSPIPCVVVATPLLAAARRVNPIRCVPMWI